MEIRPQLNINKCSVNKSVIGHVHNTRDKHKRQPQSDRQTSQPVAKCAVALHAATSTQALF